MLVFDACHAGVVIRAVLFAQAIIGIGVLFVVGDLGEWALRFAWLTGAVMPSVLMWLVVSCALKHVLARAPLYGQWLAGTMLGALTGVMGCFILHVSGGVDPGAMIWLGAGLGGAMMASIMVAWLVWRVRGRVPAATAARLVELQARIRPHFLFNTLNSAIALVRSEPDKAETLLEDLSEVFRHALKIQDDSTTLERELALAKRYLAIERVRFGSRLRVQFQLDAHANQARLPPLLLQPIVENAVKHGVEPSARGSDIHIVTRAVGTQAIIDVTNTLPEPDPQTGQKPLTAGNGMALQNVRERLFLLHDLQCQFKAGAHRGKYRVRIVIPLTL